MINNSIMLLVKYFLTASFIQAQAIEIRSTELSKHFQTHSLPNDAKVEPECKKQVKMFLDDLHDLKLWALQNQGGMIDRPGGKLTSSEAGQKQLETHLIVFDSTGKMNAGLLGGNVGHFGDYEQCLSVSHNDIKGKYCLSTLFVNARDSAPDSVKEAVDRLLSRRIITSTAQDNIKIVPSFTELYWGLCVPSGCSETDVRAMVSTLLSPYNSSETGLKFDLKMEPKPCDTKDDKHSYYNQTLFLILFGAVLWLVSHSTIVDIINGFQSQAAAKPKTETMWNKMFMAFSLKRTIPFLLDTSEPGELKCIHGLRFYFSLLIYLLHKAVFSMFVPVINRISVAEMMENEASMIIRVVWNCVDTFVLISGLLTSYFTIKKLKNGGRMNVLHMYIQRYLKFTPVFLMTLLSFTFFAKRLSSGPLMISVGNHFLDRCENIWKSVFYISNFDGINNMCYPPAHQLITDFQMYLMSPIFIFALYKWKKLGVLAVVATLVLLALYKGAVVYYYKYSTLLFYGISVSMIGDGGNDIYLNPIHRLTPYLIGVLFGYFLQEMKPQHRKLSWEKLMIGWSACLMALYYAYFSMAKAAKRNYQYSETEAALFGMAQPLLWCPAICWIIYACQTGQAGVVSRMLEWKWFVIFSRLSYPFYLVQIMIIFWSVTDVKAPQQRSLFYFIDLNEFAGLIVLSTIFSLFFLLPLKDLFNSVKGADAAKSVKIMKEFQTEEKNNYSCSEGEEETSEGKVNKKCLLNVKDQTERFDFTNIIENAVPKNENFKF